MKQYQIVTRSRIVHAQEQEVPIPHLKVNRDRKPGRLTSQAEQQQERAKQIEQAQKEGRISDLPESILVEECTRFDFLLAEIKDITIIIVILYMRSGMTWHHLFRYLHLR